MATKWINVKGTVSWAQVYEPDEYAGDKRWKVTFYPANGEEWETLRKAGVQLEAKEDKEGKKYVNLRRSVKRLYGDDVTFFTPPTITGAVSVQYLDKATGKPVRSYKKGDGTEVEVIGEKVLIGNGSVVMVNIAVYDTQKGKGHRFEAMKVLDLVSYDPDSKSDAETAVDSPEEVKAETPVAPVEKKKKEDLNDEIPW